MSEDLIFYTNPMSRGRIVRWMLEEVEAPYKTEILHYGSTMKDESYLAINPMGKVPAIVHHGRVVTECAAICAYLADAFPGRHLAPPPGERADYYRWLFFGAGPVESAVTNRNLGVDVPKERERMVGYGTFNDVMDVLEKAVSANDYLAGHSFTAADVYVGSQIVFGLQFGTIERRDAFEEYASRLVKRAAYKRATETDDRAASAIENQQN